MTKKQVVVIRPYPSVFYGMTEPLHFKLEYLYGPDGGWTRIASTKLQAFRDAKKYYPEYEIVEKPMRAHDLRDLGRLYRKLHREIEARQNARDGIYAFMDIVGGIDYLTPESRKK